MRFFKGRLPAVLILAAFIIMLAAAVIVGRVYTINVDVYWTPSTLIDGEYSIDDGPWRETDWREPIDDRFSRIVFKGTLVPTSSLGTEVDISFKNVWITLEYDDGEVIYSNLYRTEGTEIWDEVVDEEALEYFRKYMPLSLHMQHTPGFEHLTFYPGEDLPETDDRELILTVENPYPPYAAFSDLVSFTISTGNGAYLRTVRETLFMMLFFLLVCFFGLFLFPMVSFILGRINYRYLSFGCLCFLGGVYMFLHFQSRILNNYIMDPVLCMTIERMSLYSFFAALILYCRANMKQEISRIAAALAALGYLVYVLVALTLHFTNVCDLVAAAPGFNILMGVIICFLLFLLVREAQMDRSVLRYLLSWVPLLLMLLIDVVDQFLPLWGENYFVWGFAVTIVVQIIQLIFDLQRQYRQSLHYYQIQKELYEARVSIMTSQIRPHFMYNALTSIAMMCTIDPPTAQEATIIFAKYLRENMDSLKQNRPVPFAQELDHLKKYLYIEKLRFADKLNIEYDITATDFVLPLLSVQPLVENAVKHGVGMKKKGGTVKISTRETPDAYEVIVSDDGVGFDPSAPRADDGRSHVGMENTRTRLMEMCRGEIKIESTVGEGTIATVILPKEGQKRNEDIVS